MVKSGKGVRYDSLTKTMSLTKFTKAELLRRIKRLDNISNEKFLDFLLRVTNDGKTYERRVNKNNIRPIKWYSDNI